MNAKVATLRRWAPPEARRAEEHVPSSDSRVGQGDDFTPIISRLFVAIVLEGIYLFIPVSKNGIFARLS